MKSSDRIRTVVAAAAWLSCVVTVLTCARAQENTSENTIRLRLMLRRFPEADENEDGILTREEARAFLELRQSKTINKLLRGEKPKPTHANVEYGPHRRNRFDLWLAESDEPTPLIIFFHGGGWIGGDKILVQPEIVEECLKSGISIASANYRFTRHAPFPAQFHDAARVVQYLRLHADKYNIDPRRVACYGESAGADLSMWLAYHDDLADPDDEDPVRRQSTRLTCIGQIDGQTTLDPRKVRELVGNRFYRMLHWLDIYDLKSLDGLDDPKLQPLFDEVSAVTHVTKDDPPTFMYYHASESLDGRFLVVIAAHHPKFGLLLKEKLDEKGVENVYWNKKKDGPRGEMQMLKFLKKHLGVTERDEKPARDDAVRE